MTEETFIHLLSRLVFRARLSAVPGVRQAIHIETPTGTRSIDADRLSDGATSIDFKANASEEAAPQTDNVT